MSLITRFLRCLESSACSCCGLKETLALVLRFLRALLAITWALGSGRDLDGLRLSVWDLLLGGLEIFRFLCIGHIAIYSCSSPFLLGSVRRGLVDGLGIFD